MTHAKHGEAGDAAGSPTKEDHDYALAVVKKQCGLDDKEAEAKLKHVDAAALVAAGRAGRLAEVKTLLGLKEDVSK